MSVKLSEVPSTAMVLVPLLLSLLLPLGSTQTTYYIKPTAESLCTNSDNLTLVFLPGEHILNDSIVFLTDLGSLKLLGSTSLHHNVSTLQCIGDSGIILANIPIVEIAELRFLNCGSITDPKSYSLLTNTTPPDSALPTVSAIGLPDLHITNCDFHGNYLPLYFHNSAVRCQDNTFEYNTGNNGGAIYSKFSNVSFIGQNTFSVNRVTDTFINNWYSRNLYAGQGGAIYAINSHLVFEGTADFQLNHALKGGAISANFSSIDINNGTCTFEWNSAEQEGGAVYLEHSFLKHSEGDVSFVTNYAGTMDYYNATYDFCNNINTYLFSAFGGAVSMQSHSTWDSEGGSVRFFENLAGSGGAIYALSSRLNSVNIMFASNRAMTLHDCYRIDVDATFYSGGALFMSRSVLQLHGRARFEENAADYGGGGVYSIITELEFEGNIQFIRNSAGSSGGGVYSEDGTLTSLGEIEFTGNYAAEDGGGMYLDRMRINIQGKGNFTYNSAEISGGAVSIKGNDAVHFLGTTTFLWNSASNGGAVGIDRGSCTLSGNTSFVENVGVNGGAIHTQGVELVLSGHNRFIKNVAKLNGYGGAIRALKTKLTFNGTQNFINNSAMHGGGLAIANYDRKGLLYFKYNSTTNFQGNHADRHGAAILVEDPPSVYCIQPNPDPFKQIETCFLQVTEDHCNPNLLREEPTSECFDYEHFLSLKFKENVAEEGGNVLYGVTLDKCIVCFWNIYIVTGTSTFAGMTGLSIDQLALNALSDPFRVCMCHELRPNCSATTVTRKVYPGETLSVTAVAVGQLNGIIPAVIHSRLEGSDKVSLDHLQETQATTWTCTSLEYTVYSRSPNCTLLLIAEGPCGDWVEPLSIHMHFRSCPDGFALSQSGSCECDGRLQKYTNSCDINTKAITRNGDFWLGFDDSSHGLILHPHCPFDNCKLETVSFTSNSTDLQCAYRRSGTLCGACKSGLSLNLGSSQCSSCSNVFLLLFLPFAIAGFLLVIFLFVCQVTVSAGTTSGLTFYANVVAVNRSVFFPTRETNILTVFIAWLNLDLGIETCFFDGMDVYIRTWLQFAFPLYIWLLVGGITLACRYSMTVARIIGPTNPVSVLATLFLLSYTKLIRTITATFSFTTLDYPNDRSVTVWAYDGNVSYTEGKLIALFLVGLLTFVLLFLPYTLLLVTAQWVEAGSNHRLLSWANNPKVRSFLDAYHAPYKNKHRYWIGLLLALRFVLFVISAIVDINSPRDPSVNLLVLNTACIGLAVWAWNTGSMYKKWYNNILESSFILNLTILAAASLQVKVEGGNQAAVAYTSVSIAFVTSLGIITYHLIEYVTSLRLWRITIGPKLHHLWTSTRERNEEPAEIEVLSVAPPRPVTTTYVDLREPLLETQ